MRAPHLPRKLKKAFTKRWADRPLTRREARAVRRYAAMLAEGLRFCALLADVGDQLMRARRWRWVEPGDNGEPAEQTITGAEILRDYYPYWCEQMRKAGKAALISERLCVEDFAVVHWAEKLPLDPL